MAAMKDWVLSTAQPQGADRIEPIWTNSALVQHCSKQLTTWLFLGDYGNIVVMQDPESNQRLELGIVGYILFTHSQILFLGTLADDRS